MLVRDFMVPNPVKISATDSIKKAVFDFFKYRINGVVVVDKDGLLCGLVTIENFIAAVISGISFSQPVATIMDRNIVTVSLETTLDEATQIPASCLPVVDDNNKPLGIVTREEIIKVFQYQVQYFKDTATSLVEAAHDGIIVIDSRGVIIMFNEVAASLTGVNQQAALGSFVESVVPETGLINVLGRGNSIHNLELLFNDKTLSCNLSPVFSGVKIVGAVAVLKDKSPDLHSTKQLAQFQHQAEALEIIFESLKQGIIVVDKNNKVTKMNRSYEDMMGVLRDDAIGRPASDIIENSRLHIVLKTGVPEVAHIQMHKGRQIICNRVPIFKDGEIIGAIGEAIFKDISEVGALLERGNLQTVTQVQASHGDKPRIIRNFETIIGRTRPMVQAKNLAEKAAATDSNVLLCGENGTGKELFAQVIHNISNRYDKPFITVSCSDPVEIIEKELFGSDSNNRGKLEAANGGTIFLDDIGDMPLVIQSKLLHFVQEKQFSQDDRSIKNYDVRIIAATDRDILKMIQNKTFREDLYYLLNVICIKLPPLRKRREDIGELIEILTPHVCRRLEVAPKIFSPEALELLRDYEWPGNVSELINIIEQLGIVVSSPVILPKHLAALNISVPHVKNCEVRQLVYGPFKDTAQSEHDRIIEVLRCTNGNKQLAAKMLGIHRSTLYEKLKRYNLK